MDLSWQSINAAFAWLQKMRSKYQEWSKARNPNSHEDMTTQRYISAIYRDFCDDLDTPRAIMKLRSLEKDRELTDFQKAKVIDEVDSLFGLNLTIQVSQDDISDTAKAILERREAARTAKDFKESDALRDELAALGIEVRDGSEGQTWTRISRA